MIVENIFGPSASGPLYKALRISASDSKRNYSGYAAVLNHSATISQFIDKGMFAYDFSRYRAIPDDLCDFKKNPHLRGVEYRPLVGKTVRQIFEEMPDRDSVALVVNSQIGNGWETNALLVHDGRIIKKTAAGIRADRFIPLTGTFPLFSLELPSPGIEYLTFDAGEVIGSTRINNGVGGPVLFEEGISKTHTITEVIPNTGPQQVVWQPSAYNGSMTIAGINNEGRTFFGSFTGERLTFAAITGILTEALDVYSAMLWGTSGDTQMVLRPDLKTEYWVAGQSRPGSALEKMFHVTWDANGRPNNSRLLSNAIIVR